MAPIDVVVDGAKFTGFITPPSSSETLQLIGHGQTDMTIETIEVKYTIIGVYVSPDIKNHLQAWIGKPDSQLTEDSTFFADFVNAPVQKLVQIVVYKGLKGRQYGESLESSIRELLVDDDKYEEEEEQALAGLVEYFSPKSLAKGATIFFTWPSPSALQVAVSVDGSLPENFEHSVANEHVAKKLLHWIVGESSISPSTTASVTHGVSLLA